MPTLNKIISLYDAEAKKNKSYILNLNNFADEAALDAHIQQMRADQKQKNKAYRQRTIDYTDYKMSNLSTVVTIQNDYELILDPGTGNSTVILGSSKRGKSTLLMNIYDRYYSKDKKFISTLFSINAHIPIYKKAKRLLLSDCFNKRSQKYIKLQRYINSKTNNEYEFLNMFDDVIDMKHSKLINQLVLTYRNSHISTIMCLQYGYLLSKMNRANINNVFIFGSNSNESILDLIKTYLKPHFIRLGFKKIDDQVKLFKYVTDNHGFIYIHPVSDTISFHRLGLN